MSSNDGELVDRGQLETRIPVHGVKVSKHGDFTAIGVEKAGGLEIVVFREFLGFLQHTSLQFCGQSVLWLQKALSERGINPGPQDGILGARTKSAFHS
ncbi:peptidoglycan-binding protein [Roseovarius sp. MMSF_3305]|uniref:peptidoglycan-binding domain-containing protein n=1 Tax=Roseovarius sp. MMSF_3305 TaxID=3046697 RepID=UPI00273F3C51|nr:peptidoglycan-binding domain-containing protein [Roseovarius sp. MMSF_3305]